MRRQLRSRLMYIVMAGLAFNAVMDLWLWSSIGYLIPSFTVSIFCFAFIAMLYVLKTLLDKEK